ncbi:MAG: hypothetical protein VW851_02425, partial [Cryomorphaceae bacterium]
ALLVSLQDEWQQLDALLTSLGVDTAAELAEINETLQGFASMEAISSVLSSVVGGLGQFIIGLFSITFISFFLFREQDLAHRFVDSITPKKYHDKVDDATDQNCSDSVQLWYSFSNYRHLHSTSHWNDTHWR